MGPSVRRRQCGVVSVYAVESQSITHAHGVTAVFGLVACDMVTAQ